MTRPSPTSLDLLDWELLSEAGIDLSPEQIARAMQWSQASSASTGAEVQWQAYVNALALVGVAQWLAEWAPEFPVDLANCTLVSAPAAARTTSGSPPGTNHAIHPATQLVTNAVAQVRVGPSELCLLVSCDRQDPTITCPRVLLDAARANPAPFASASRDQSVGPSLTQPTAAQFYLLVEVLEEQMQTLVYGYVAQAELQARQSDLVLAASDWGAEAEAWGAEAEAYALPLAWFNPDPMKLLLELRCLAPATEPGRSHSTLPERAINAAAWLSDRLDHLAQELAWVLLPTLTPAAALRSGDQRAIEQVLESLDMPIPPTARGAYQDLQLGPAALRLYAFTWPLTLSDGRNGWTLFTLLSAQPGHQLPRGIQLQIRDPLQVLATEILRPDRSQPNATQPDATQPNATQPDATQSDATQPDGTQPDSPEAYLYAQVGGLWQEQLIVSLQLASGEHLTLPPFTFNPTVEQ